MSGRVALLGKADRNQQIITAYLAGETVTALAAQHQVSRQRINQLVRAAGCAHRKPGMAENRARVAAQD